MNLLHRIARLEREVIPAPASCPKCSTTHYWPWPDDRLNDPTWRPVCDVCGRDLSGGGMKFIVQSALDDV